jgi:prlF antitoxin for toxin YhaV_toxin
VTSEEDPLVGAFLSFLEKDIQDEPANITSLNADAIERAKALTAGIVVTDDDFNE